MKKTLLLIAVLTTSLLAAQNVPSYVPTNGLVGWWPFNGDADDESGNNNNGTVYGAVLALDRQGVSNGAYHFDGIDDYISIPHNDTLAITSDITMHAIFRSEGYNGSSVHQTVLNKRSGGYWPYNLSICYASHADKKILSGRRNVGPTNDYKYSSDEISVNQWEVWTITIQSDTIKFYRNGVIDTVQYFSLSSVDVAAELLFGRNGLNEGLPEFFKGEIDEIGIWDRALTYPEVSLLYSGCSDTITSEPMSNTFQTVPGTAHFVTSHSDSTATYQWQQNNGTGWTNLSDFGIYSGTTSDSIVLTGITTSLNGYGYRCIIDACTMDTTDVAFLTVVDNVGIDEDEATITVAPNPTSGILTIGLNSTTEYKVYNVNGQVVAKGNTDGQIDLTNLPSGSYQLILDSEEGSSVHAIQKI